MRRDLVAWTFAAAALFCLSLSAFAQKPDILEVIEVTGEIHGGAAMRLADQVQQINENPKVRAVLFVIDSPGGSVTASATMYEELSKLKVPVVGWCMNVCASGAIYALMSPSVKHIGVRTQTISGSVGVVMQVMRFNRLLEWAKVDSETFVSGALKDAGNSSRAAREDERKYLQGIVGVLADRFYSLVGERRKIKDWDAIKSARIFIGDEAVKVGLVDAVMTREEAIAKAKALSGAKQIFTREELKKMSSAADGPHGYSLPMTPFGDVPWLIETLKEVKSGGSVSFSYRMPYAF